MGGITSISSDNYSGSNTGATNTFKPTQSTVKPLTSTKENPEKQKLASDIFKGIGDSSGKAGGGGLFSSMNVNMKPSMPKNNPFGKASTAKPNVNSGGTIDLLDLNDDIEVTNNSNNNNKPSDNPVQLWDVLGGVKPEENNQTKKDNNLFANLNKKKAATPFNKLTQPFQVEHFESNWESMPEELIERFDSKIKSEQDFKNLTESLGINIIEIIDNEIICAGLNEQKEIILIYGIYNPNGNVEIRIKAKTQTEMSRIMKVVKLYAI